ncbi:hypothetical protein U1Q18_028085 [Sarracenia purpurea var. burkii]
MSLEPLDLSLSLPNVLLLINSHPLVQAPGSPSLARSEQSFPSTFYMNSDRFTASISFSGSHPFTHNPSCSLTHNNSFDNYEQFVGSRPLFQPVDLVSPATWHGQSANEQKHKCPMDQREYNQSSIMQETLHIVLGLTKTDQNVVKRRCGYRERKELVVYMRAITKMRKQILIRGAYFVVPIITMVVSEPVHVMAKKLNEMTGQSIVCLKDSVRDIILNSGKRWQLSAFQKALQNRSDITLEMQLKSHRAQLEILVALRTGLQEFLQRNYDISTSDLAEIFLNLRCRNLTRQNLLPVDECDCKACVQKNGFCSSCMCLVCSKFGMASNTCSWVGCDVCLHWCHADCALRESYIRNGCSASKPHGGTEMQFHCIACDHPSEMFGFVKEVFSELCEGLDG